MYTKKTLVNVLNLVALTPGGDCSMHCCIETQCWQLVQLARFVRSRVHVASQDLMQHGHGRSEKTTWILECAVQCGTHATSVAATNPSYIWIIIWLVCLASQLPSQIPAMQSTCFRRLVREWLGFDVNNKLVPGYWTNIYIYVYNIYIYILYVRLNIYMYIYIYVRLYIYSTNSYCILSRCTELYIRSPYKIS